VGIKAEFEIELKNARFRVWFCGEDQKRSSHDDDTNGHTRKKRGLVGFCFQTYTVGCMGSGGL
jgi:hypothetical protein